MTTAPGKAKVRAAKQFLDSQLVEDCLQGKEAAWSALIAKYKNLIYSIPVRYSFSEEDSADIFQAVCLDLLKELPTLREPNALAGWLVQVTRNKCFHRKQAQLRSKVQGIDDLDTLTSPAMPKDVTVEVEQEQLLREAILILSPRCQRLVHMLFFEMPARPYQQVAHDLNLAEGSIGFIRRRCLNKLRDRLEELGYSLS